MHTQYDSNKSSNGVVCLKIHFYCTILLLAGFYLMNFSRNAESTVPEQHSSYSHSVKAAINYSDECVGW